MERLGRRRKIQGANPKFQESSKGQESKVQGHRLAVRVPLETFLLEAWFLLGIWNLELGTFPVALFPLGLP